MNQVWTCDGMITVVAWLWSIDGVIIGDLWLWSVYFTVRSSCLAAMVMAWTTAFSLYYISRRFLPEKLKGPQPINKFPAFYGNHRFVHIVVFITVRFWLLSWASWFQFPTTISISLLFILIFFSNLLLGLHSFVQISNQEAMWIFLLVRVFYLPHPSWPSFHRS